MKKEKDKRKRSILVPINFGLSKRMGHLIDQLMFRTK
jgi:hypothetical protein